ncbi:CRISPR-associated endonuclease Cas2 [Desulfocicer vacuolatum]|nr:CRISPR-associated endonuclease Cas2 [Desulfocicer vacuolatum]
MFCYDIADPKRLVKVHRLMKKSGLAVQKSIFFIQGTELQMKALLGDLGKLIKPKYDDIRAYPVESPDKVWTTGGVLESYPLIVLEDKKEHNSHGKPSSSTASSAKVSFWRRLWKK